MNLPLDVISEDFQHILRGLLGGEDAGGKVAAGVAVEEDMFRGGVEAVLDAAEA